MATGYKTGGREAGTPNKSTKEVKEAFQAMLSNNIDNLEIWLKDIAKENPAKAFGIILKLSEFVLPKMKTIEGDLKINSLEEQKKMIASIIEGLPIVE